ncbi:MAG: EAL domain-containing protein [Myxococcota bacterium]|nr:EAL domain-containing protein [Myxococcota bacterium]
MSDEPELGKNERKRLENRIAVEEEARRAAERRAAEAEQARDRLVHVLEESPDLVLIEEDGRLTFANRAARRFHGLGEGGAALCEVAPDELVAPASRGLMRQARAALAEHGSWQGEIQRERHDGALVPMMTQLNGGTDADGVEALVVCVSHDLSRQTIQEAELEEIANTDELTGLPNRRKFLEETRRALTDAADQPGQVGILVANIDGFQMVNDTLGPAAGDRLLVAVADRIQGVVRATDLMARVGGDEFAVLSVSTDEEGLLPLGERMLAVMAPAFRIGRRKLTVTLSIGVVTPSRRRVEPDALLRDANAAVSQAKAKGRSRVEHFDPVRRLQSVARLELEQELRTAIRDGNIQVVYQHEIGLSTGDLVCFEALARWEHERMGPISPADFVPLAEETGLIGPLGERVAADVCSQLRRWEAEGLRDLVVSVNVSPRQLASADFVDRIQAIVDGSGIQRHQINLEITESAMTDQSRVMLGRIRALREAGFTLILDDFGTGYSSLGQLRTLPFSVLKIDRTFVADIVDDEQDRHLVDAMIRMAHGLGRMVVAEGVETEAQAEILRNLKCEIGQGWHFGRPLPGDRMTEVLLSRRETGRAKVRGA